MIDPIDIDATRAICAAAPAGPWVGGSRGAIFDRAGELICEADEYTRPIERFIVLARTALPQALNEIERLRSSVEYLSIQQFELRTLVDELRNSKIDLMEDLQRALNAAQTRFGHMREGAP